MKEPCVYMLASKPNGALYVGVTSDLVKRVWEHKCGVHAGFTKRHRVNKLVWFERHETMESAIGREKQLKKWNRMWKVREIGATNPLWQDLYGQLVEGELGPRLRGDDKKMCAPLHGGRPL